VESASASRAGRSDRRKWTSGARGACRSRECGTTPIRPWSGYPPLHRAKRCRSAATIRWGTSKRLLPDFPFALIALPELASSARSLEGAAGGFAAALPGAEVAGEHRVDASHVVVARILDHRVRAKPGDSSPHETHRLVHRIGESLASVAADDQRSLLGHEP